MDISLDDNQVLQIAGSGTRVFIYPKIAYMTSLSNLINEEFPKAIILYQINNKNNNVYGHWVSIKIIKNTICYFDSYGNMIDFPLTKINKGYRIKTKQLFKKLSFLIAYAPYTNINYNQYKYQSYNKKITTCGRHAAYFLRTDLNIEQYNKYMKMVKKDLGYNSYDELIVDLTNYFLNE